MHGLKLVGKRVRQRSRLAGKHSEILPWISRCLQMASWQSDLVMNTDHFGHASSFWNWGGLSPDPWVPTTTCSLTWALSIRYCKHESGPISGAASHFPHLSFLNHPINQHHARLPLLYPLCPWYVSNQLPSHLQLCVCFSMSSSAPRTLWSGSCSRLP
jgi:hypothetical protein